MEQFFLEGLDLVERFWRAFHSTCFREEEGHGQEDVGVLWKLERARKEIPPPEGMQPYRSMLESDLQMRDKRVVCCVKPLRLW